ncbi:C40 family peptidase [Paenibacillus sp. Soil787]|uniref:C40 family peptidase n=1 Tax=Paenibacillus sp. Soil787 TaxID=1736411 RepID=UPI0006F1E3D5|nr:C40 family peptidase [Paenibacillus sp. Soil787]KRF31782.1 hydrolase Nlp/P60 [Paenibacillus sp. Soil787]
MKHSKKMLTVLSCLLVLTGCGKGNVAPQKVGVSTQQGGMDNRILDPKIINQDVLLQRGDANVELEQRGYRAQDVAPSTNGSIKILSGNHELVQVWPNPSIQPKEGSYAENVVSQAAMFYGTPYEFSSDRSDPSTFDCSDFTRWVYLSSLGMDLPKDSRSQASYVQSFSNRTYTSIDQAQRGDLLFFVSYKGTDPDQYIGIDKSIGNITHVGLSLGNGKIIHTASAATGGVRIDELANNHLTYRFVLGGSLLNTK